MGGPIPEGVRDPLPNGRGDRTPRYLYILIYNLI